MTDLCRNEPEFISRLVSGPNSIDITTMHCRIERKEINRYLEHSGFTISSLGKLEKGSMEVELTTNSTSDEIIAITLLIRQGNH